MIVSFSWLKDYVSLDVPHEEVEQRLMMAGLNHEGTERVGDDLAIDLEVTSNRPDCLGHVGVAREAAVLFGGELAIPAARPAENGPPVGELTDVAIECPDLCYRYTARVIRGVKIGCSPAWLARRLQAIGLAVVNNIVDVTNYVLMECGQPLHAFDFQRLAGRRIIVREANRGEEFEAIDHRRYQLEPGMCVIADAERAVALGGVMGGADSEVSDSTTDLLIESAEFAPQSIRTAARKLGLHSPSSHRFERGVDPAGVDWASRRCCELILNLAGGKLAAGVVDVGRELPARPPIVLRLSQLKRILGIDIPAEEVRRILTRLGCEERSATGERIEVMPPSWRRDLTREIDLVEEAGRIHGYELIPEDVGVAMVASARSDEDRATERVRNALTAAGFSEAMTTSAVSEAWSEAYSPWCELPALRAQTPVLERDDRLRRSLIPSLLGAKRFNEARANPHCELFELARVYLPQPQGLPAEPRMLGLVSGGDFRRVKGAVEAVLDVLNVAGLAIADFAHPLFTSGRAAELRLGDQILGYIGEVSAEGLKRFELRSPATVAELKMPVLLEAAVLVPIEQPVSQFPAVTRDLNVELEEAVRWGDVAAIATARGGELLEECEFREVYRDPQHVGPGKKRLLFTLTLRSQTETLTREAADEVRDRIVAEIQKKLGGALVA